MHIFCARAELGGQLATISELRRLLDLLASFPTTEAQDRAIIEVRLGMFFCLFVYVCKTCCSRLLAKFPMTAIQSQPRECVSLPGILAGGAWCAACR